MWDETIAGFLGTRISPVFTVLDVLAMELLVCNLIYDIGTRGRLGCLSREMGVAHCLASSRTSISQHPSTEYVAWDYLLMIDHGHPSATASGP